MVLGAFPCPPLLGEIFFSVVWEGGGPGSLGVTVPGEEKQKSFALLAVSPSIHSSICLCHRHLSGDSALGVCVCACVCARVRVYVRVCVCMCACASVAEGGVAGVDGTERGCTSRRHSRQRAGAPRCPWEPRSGRAAEDAGPASAGQRSRPPWRLPRAEPHRSCPRSRRLPRRSPGRAPEAWVAAPRYHSPAPSVGRGPRKLW